MKHEADRNKEAISRVRCHVEKCHYYAPGNKCTADMIEISPPHASTSEETDCATFMPKRSL